MYVDHYAGTAISGTRIVTFPSCKCMVSDVAINPLLCRFPPIQRFSDCGRLGQNLTDPEITIDGIHEFTKNIALKQTSKESDVNSSGSSTDISRLQNHIRSDDRDHILRSRYRLLH
jgi:hypothetical protein